MNMEGNGCIVPHILINSKEWGVNGQLHALAALSLSIRTCVRVKCEAGCAPGRSWKLWKRVNLVMCCAWSAD